MAVLIKTRRDGGASYASISVVAPVLASSRFRENPRSFGPFLSPRPLFFFRFPLRNLRVSAATRQITIIVGVPSTPDARQISTYHRGFHSFSVLSPPALGAQLDYRVLAFPPLLSLFLPSRRFYSFVSSRSRSRAELSLLQLRERIARFDSDRIVNIDFPFEYVSKEIVNIPRSPRRTNF